MSLLYFFRAWPLMHLIIGDVGSNASKASQHKRKTQMKYKVTKVQQPSLNHLTNALKEGLHIKNATYNML